MTTRKIVLSFIVVALALVVVSKPVNAGTFACRWNSGTNTCEPDNATCSDGAALPSTAASTCSSITVRTDCNDFAYPCQPALFVPQGSCPVAAPTSICTYSSYPSNYPPGVCQQGGSCSDALDPGSNARQYWFCCNHPAACVPAAGGGLGIDTPIGCIPISSPQRTVEFFLRFALGIVGGLALLFVFLGGFQVLTSAGNPQRVQAGKELITAAATGLGLVIFSVFVLRLLGVNILQIPGL